MLLVKNMLSILIPAYNEEKTICELIRQIKDVDLGPVTKEIIVVDNNSTDRTHAVCAEIPGIMLLTETAAGKGAALKRALQEAHGEYVIFQDADLEYDPNDYRAMLEPLLTGKADAVLGVRIEGRKPYGFIIYVFGWLGNHLITLLTNALYGHNSKEYEGCYKAFKKEVLNSVKVHTNDFDYDNELICKLLKRNYRIVDVPIHYYPRKYADGKKIRWTHGFLILWTIVKYRFVD